MPPPLLRRWGESMPPEPRPAEALLNWPPLSDCGLVVLLCFMLVCLPSSGHLARSQPTVVIAGRSQGLQVEASHTFHRLPVFLVYVLRVEPGSACRIGWRQDWACVGHDPLVGMPRRGFFIFYDVAAVKDEQASPPGLASCFFPHP